MYTSWTPECTYWLWSSITTVCYNLLSTSREKRILLPLCSSHLEKSADSRVPTNLQGWCWLQVVNPSSESKFPLFPQLFYVRLALIRLQENSPEFDNKKSFVQYMDRWQLSYSFVECLYTRGSVLTLITMLKDGILKWRN